MKKNGIRQRIYELLDKATEEEARAILIILLNMQNAGQGKQHAKKEPT